MPSAGDVERARALKEEGNELVKKGNHKQAIEKYSESLWFSNLESATYSNRYLSHGWPGGFQDTGHSSTVFSRTVMGSASWHLVSIGRPQSCLRVGSRPPQ